MKNGNSPASPCANETNNPRGGFGVDLRNFTGLTKRELIAAMAMQGLASVRCPGGLTEEAIDNDVVKAVRYADSLLSELEHTA